MSRQFFLAFIFLAPAAALAQAVYCPNGAALPKPYICLRNFYVDASKGSDSNSGAADSPWLTIQRANDAGGLKAGDCVNVAPGAYLQPTAAVDGLALTHGGDANTPAGHVAYIGAEGHKSRIARHSSTYGLVNIQAPYIILDGFDIDGALIAGPAVNLQYSVASAHHLQVLNSWIHDAGGGGIETDGGDYFTFIGNTVYNNAGANRYQMSGISIYEPTEIPGFTPTLPADRSPFHMIVSNNIVYNNFLTKAVRGPHYDGDGIIMDDWRHTQQEPHVAYPHQGLVQSNLVYGNGGGGIRVFLSSGVTVANNTVYNNYLDRAIAGRWRGELSVQSSDHTTWINNIAWAVPGRGPLAYNKAIQDQANGASDAQNSWIGNITFNGTPGEASAEFSTEAYAAAFRADNQAGVDPRLTKFVPEPGSPAIGAGVLTPAYPPTSLCGEPMPSPPHVGALGRPSR